MLESLPLGVCMGCACAHARARAHARTRAPRHTRAAHTHARDLFGPRLCSRPRLARAQDTAARAAGIYKHRSALPEATWRTGCAGRRPSLSFFGGRAAAGRSSGPGLTAAAAAASPPGAPAPPPAAGAGDAPGPASAGSGPPPGHRPRPPPVRPAPAARAADNAGSGRGQGPALRQTSCEVDTGLQTFLKLVGIRSKKIIYLFRVAGG